MNKRSLAFCLSVVLIFSSCSQSRYGYISRYKDKKQEQNAPPVVYETEVEDQKAEEKKEATRESVAVGTADENGAEILKEPETPEKQHKNPGTSKALKAVRIMISPQRAIKPLKQPDVVPQENSDDSGSCCAVFIAIVLLWVIVYILGKVLFGIEISFWVFILVFIGIILLFAILRYARG